MTNTGPAIKILRERRGYAPKQMYEGVMSRTNYARFERGQIDTSSANFVTLIKRLDAHTLGWERIYRVLEKQTSGMETPTLPNIDFDQCQLLHAHAYHEAADAAAKAFAVTHYPGWEHAQWLNLAYATYLENNRDLQAPNEWVTTIQRYLAGLTQWFSPDFGLAAGITGLIDAPATVKLATRYLAEIKQTPNLEVGNLVPKTRGEMLVLWMRAPIKARDWARYSQLLALFDQTPQDQRELVPAVMKRLYHMFADYHSGHVEAIKAVPSLLGVVEGLDQPRLFREANDAAAALNAWLVADKL